MTEHVSGGYILLARRTLTSEVWQMPPHVFKVWIYLLLKASRGPEAGHRLERGQLLTSIPEIQRATEYRAGYRPKRLSKHQVWRACEALRERDMIATTKTTRGMIVTICKYDTYQSPATYGRDNEKPTGATTGATMPRHDRQEPNKKKEENTYTRLFDLWNAQKVIVHRKMDDATKRKIHARMREYTEQELSAAIENYGRVYRGPEFFFGYKWTLHDFMLRGYRKFLDEAAPLENFRNKKGGPSHENMPVGGKYSNAGL